MKEKTPLESKLKLLEIENKLLEDVDSNKQKFIDNVLGCDTNLVNSWNFDIVPVIRETKWNWAAKQ